jgi:hypothetical protein
MHLIKQRATRKERACSSELSSGTPGQSPPSLLKPLFLFLVYQELQQVYGWGRGERQGEVGGNGKAGNRLLRH